MNYKQFECEFMNILRIHPEGYEDGHWTIKYDVTDREYYVRWSNGLMDHRHRQFRAYFKDGKFNYI